jgi:hypothetical protein
LFSLPNLLALRSVPAPRGMLNAGASTNVYWACGSTIIR